MRIQVNPQILSDSPYNDNNQLLFSAADYGVSDLVADIKYGNPTCYLISGYRGAGKSSFIRKVEKGVKDAPQPETSTAQQTVPVAMNREVVFVHTNFSKYQSQSFLLRKLIRGLYLALKNKRSFGEFKKEEAASKDLNADRYGELLERLYEKTFYETISSDASTNKTAITTKAEFDFQAFLKTVIGSVVTSLFGLNAFVLYMGADRLFSTVIAVLSSITLGLTFVKLKHSRSDSEIRKEEFNRKSLYDDEIAEHHFFSLLTGLSKKYRVVFVLDELDKIAEKPMERLLAEMKPYLVSGAASFIVVAGQNLYYKYFESKQVDDGLLSSLFSRCIHIHLLSREELKIIFQQIVVREEIVMSTSDERLLDLFMDYLIFQAKRIPRSFVSLIRQQIVWEGNSAFIDIPNTPEVFDVYAKAVDVIEDIEEADIASRGMDRALRDYLIMNLYLRCHRILATGVTFTLEQILNDEE